MYRIQKKVNLFDRVLLLVIALLLGVLSFVNLHALLMRLSGEALEPSGTRILYLVLIVCLWVYSFVCKKKPLTIFFWMSASYFILSYLIYVPFNFDRLGALLMLMLWMFCYWFGRRLSATNVEYILFFTRAILFTVIIPLAVYSVYIFFTTNLFKFQHVSDAFFYIVAYLPFVFLIKNRPLKTVMICLFAVLAVISFKRSIIIGFLICLFVYFVTSYKEYLSKWYRWLLLIAVFVFGYYLYNEFSETLTARFSKLETDQGSDRLVIYNQIFNRLSHSNFIDLAFGHGFKSVKSIDAEHRLAHNDFLELIYDFGIVGLVIYILFIFSLLKSALKLRTNKSLFPAFLGSLAFFISIAFSNCVIYSPMIISPFMLAFGIYTGIQQYGKYTIT